MKLLGHLLVRLLRLVLWHLLVGIWARRPLLRLAVCAIAASTAMRMAMVVRMPAVVPVADRPLALGIGLRIRIRIGRGRIRRRLVAGLVNPLGPVVYAAHYTIASLSVAKLPLSCSSPPHRISRQGRKEKTHPLSFSDLVPHCPPRRRPTALICRSPCVLPASAGSRWAGSPLSLTVACLLSSWSWSFATLRTAALCVLVVAT